jgi:tetratricopeptide (TPR) repeat protein
MEMPAITQMLLLFVVILCGPSWEPSPADSSRIRSAPKGMMAACGLAVLAFSGCLMTATLPAWYRGLYVSSGDAALSRDFNAVAAGKWYEKAEQADPYSPEPVERLGELHFLSWVKNLRESDFRQAVRYGQLAIERDPASNRGYRQLGRWYYQRAASQHSPADASLAVEYFLQAVARYPHSAGLRAELSLAFRQAEQPQQAKDEARLALELDQINRDAGHFDKILPSSLRKSLVQISQYGQAFCGNIGKGLFPWRLIAGISFLQ